MPRIARAVAQGYPHHVVQRGNNKGDVFFNEKDICQYLFLLKKYSVKWNCPVLAYCLMNNHVHLLLRPFEEISLYKTMQGITLCYTQYINKTYKRTGRLWESRYHSCIVDTDNYLWLVVRYIEQNPLRAKMVKRINEYLFSSARAHTDTVKDDVLGEELFDKRMKREYKNFVNIEGAEEEIKKIRYFTKTGRPLGNHRFISAMEKKLNRKFNLLSPGRPKKDEFQK